VRLRSARLAQEAEGAGGRLKQTKQQTNWKGRRAAAFLSGSFAIFAAIRRADLSERWQTVESRSRE
jgi:hypothetical protein